MLLNRSLTAGDQSDLPAWARREAATLLVDGDDDEGATATTSSDPDIVAMRSKYKTVIPKTPTKIHTKRVGNAHVTDESDTPTNQKSLIKGLPGQHISQETTATDDKATVAMVKERHVSQEMESSTDDMKSSVKFVPGAGATQQSEDLEDNRPHLKTVTDQYSTKESDPSKEDDLAQSKHIKFNPDMYATKESAPLEDRIKKASYFGHVSQLSMKEFSIPKIKRGTNHSATKETMDTDFGCYHIKPHRRRKVEGQDAGMETVQVESKPVIKSSATMQASTESEYIDHDAHRLSKFRNQNVYGHASDSSVQKLLYGKNYGQTVSVIHQTG